MKTLSKLVLREHGIKQSDFVSKKAQQSLVGGKGDIMCRCGFYGGYTSSCWSCYGSIEDCLTIAGQICSGDGATCSGEDWYPISC